MRTDARAQRRALSRCVLVKVPRSVVIEMIDQLQEGLLSMGKNKLQLGRKAAL